MTSAEQAEAGIRDAILAEIFRQNISLSTLAERINQPTAIVASAFRSSRMSVGTASLLAHAMGCRLMPTDDGRSMKPVPAT